MTVKGDKVVNITSTEDDAYLDMQPSSGEEWTIHNVYWGGAAELYVTNGTNYILVGSSDTSGGRLNCYLNCTNTIYYTIKNINGDTQYLGYDGVATKVV